MLPILSRGWRIWVDLPLMIKGMIVVALPLGLCTALAVITLQVFQTQRGELEHWIRDAFQAGSRIQVIITLLTDAESGARGFVITHDEKYREPYAKAERELPQRLSLLLSAYEVNSPQWQRVRRVEALSRSRLEALKAIMAESELSVLQRRFEQDRAFRDSLQSEAAAFRTAESNLWATRIGSETALRKRMSTATYVSALIGLLVGSLTMALFVTGIVQRSQVLRVNADLLARGEPLVDLPPGRDEIGQLGAALTRSSQLLTDRERQLRHLNRELDARVKERTDQLEREVADRRRSEEQLQQAQRLESIGRLAGGVAHDFNNLLTVINGYAEALTSELPPDDPMREGLSEIRDAGERAAGLTQQLLAFSRRQIVQPAVVNVNTVVLDIQKMLRRLIGEDIDLRTNLATNLANVIIDAGQLQQVIMNLTVNSRDAMPGGGVLLIETQNVVFDDTSVAAHPGVRPGPHVMLAVTDTGTGMTEEVKNRMFEPFFTTKPQGAGTGLGLASVYGMVKQAGGWIWVYSEPGQGTSSKCYFPVCDQPLSHPRSIPKTDVRGTETILVVEDQPEVRRLTVAALQKYGYTVFAACNGGEALSLVQELTVTIDLLVTDVVMPGMNGLTLAQTLTGSRPDLQVLFMSGYTDEAIAHHGVLLEPGGPYLQKPFTPESLGEKVRQVLGPRQVATATVLVVDDEDGVRRFVSHVLTRAGYAVLEAANGRQALEHLSSAPHVDLVITDLVMPEQEGLETIRQIHQQYAGVKVLAISGAFDGDFLQLAARMGAIATLRKPLNTDDLLKAVRELLT